MSHSAHVWIPLRRNEKWKELQNQKQGKSEKLLSLLIVVKFVQKFEVQKQRNKVW